MFEKMIKTWLLTLVTLLGALWAYKEVQQHNMNVYHQAMNRCGKVFNNEITKEFDVYKKCLKIEGKFYIGSMPCKDGELSCRLMSLDN